VIRAVTFDFWQTLADDSAENLAAQTRLRLEALSAALAAAGLDAEPGAVAAGYQRSQAILESRFWNLHRDPGYAEQVALVLDGIVPGASSRLAGAAWEALLQGYGDPVLRFPPVLCPGAATAVRALAARGVALGVVSNTGRTPGAVLRRYLERQGLASHFHVLSFSDEVGVRKPEAEIFRRTLGKLGAVAPEEVAHIGDNPNADVEGARALGLRALHYVVGDRTASARAHLVIDDLAALPGRLAEL
jgi:putative hydrolase of the HAD superfamily